MRRPPPLPRRRRPAPAGLALGPLALLAALAALPARAADVFSPGPLSRAHQALEGGLESCTKCHVAGRQLSPDRCLECHTELKVRVEEGRGFHGRMAAADRTCQSCHHEHQGRDEPLVDWGKGGQKAFDHARTGFELKGKHRTADCARCHDSRRAAEPIRAMLQKQPSRKTFLGQAQACNGCHFDEHRGQLGTDCARCHAEDAWKPARGFDHARAAFQLAGGHLRAACAKCHSPQAQAAEGVPATVTPPLNPASFTRYKGLAFDRCTTCHFDEHRGQVGVDCARCHGEDAWKPARRFDHARSAFPLTGRHARVDCAKCHLPEVDATGARPAPGVTPPVNAERFQKLKGLAFGQCTDCHKDPHRDRFGPTCTQCHGTEDWKRVTGAAGQRAFHEQTRYPLRGAHAAVACAACHGPSPGQPARFRGLEFGRCTDCHLDGHLGQLTTPVAQVADGRTCDRCHTVDSYLPARFELEDHDRTGFKLEGAHRAAACVRCHPRDAALASLLAPAVRAQLEERKRPVRISLARFAPTRADDCQACHKDPHAGQFDRRARAGGCGACHGTGSFRELRFDHARDAAFPLTGKHAQAACASCHRPDAAGVVRYAPLASACATCHADPHAAQFAAGKGQATDCSRCHGAESFKATTFVHAPPFTDFRLEGKHQGLDCQKCHLPVAVGGVMVRRYRPLPTRCQGCHEDFHQGAFRRFVP